MWAISHLHRSCEIGERVHIFASVYGKTVTDEEYLKAKNNCFFLKGKSNIAFCLGKVPLSCQRKLADSSTSSILNRLYLQHDEQKLKTQLMWLKNTNTSDSYRLLRINVTDKIFSGSLT